jgi:ribose/xylose/arabinose/galactoside ABC-type transport system permease subunit
MRTSAGQAVAVPGPGAWRPRLRDSTRAAAGLGRSRAGISVVLLLIMVIGLLIRDPRALTSVGVDLLLQSALPVVLVAMGQQFVILAGDFDIGIGYAVGLANVITATLLVTNVALGVLALIGMVAAYVAMAVVIEVAEVPGIVITLGMSFVWLGVGLLMQAAPGGSAPGWLAGTLGAFLPGVPEPVYLTVALGVVGFVILRRSAWGARLRGFGGSRSAFVRTGRSPLRARAALYALAGACVVAAGMMTTVVFASSDINGSQTLTLASVAAVIIGGGQFVGGVVDPVGTVVAAVALSVIPVLLGGFNISTNYQPAVEGAILIIVMTLRWLAQRQRQAGR